MVRLGSVSEETRGVVIYNYVEDLIYLCPGQFFHWPWPGNCGRSFRGQ